MLVKLLIKVIIAGTLSAGFAVHCSAIDPPAIEIPGFGKIDPPSIDFENETTFHGVYKNRKGNWMLESMANGNPNGKYLDIDGQTGKVIVSSRGSGTIWSLSRNDDGDYYQFANLCRTCSHRGLKLDVNNERKAIVSERGSGTRWALEFRGSGNVVRLKSKAKNLQEDLYLDVSQNGEVGVSERGSGTKWRLIFVEVE